MDSKKKVTIEKVVCILVDVLMFIPVKEYFEADIVNEIVLVPDLKELMAIAAFIFAYVLIGGFIWGLIYFLAALIVCVGINAISRLIYKAFFNKNESLILYERDD